jgi:uncharacterized membrane protein YidH (DUF202 family)
MIWGRHNSLSSRQVPASTTPEDDFALERYKYILNQIHAINENVYRFLAVYQTLAVAIVGGGLALFVGYRKWQIASSVARTGIAGLMWLVTMVAAFTVLLIVMGVLNWWDYRVEECELTDAAVRPGFRRPPRLKNLFRWYETYIVLFIIGSVAFLWAFALAFIMPAMR